MADQFLHPDVWPLFLKLLEQMQYPEAHKLVARYSRHWVGMPEIEDLDRREWERTFSYPPQIRAALYALETLYEAGMGLNPDVYKEHPYYDPRVIQIFFVILGEQKKFTLQFANAFLSATHTHQETMHNRRVDAEQHESTVNTILNAARALWYLMSEGLGT